MSVILIIAILAIAILVFAQVISRLYNGPRACGFGRNAEILEPRFRRMFEEDYRS